MYEAPKALSYFFESAQKCAQSAIVRLYSQIIFSQVIVVFNFIDTGELDYGGYVLPGWAHAIGWMVAVIPIVLIPVYAVLVYIYDVMCYPDSEESILEVRGRSPTLMLLIE